MISLKVEGTIMTTLAGSFVSTVWTVSSSASTMIFALLASHLFARSQFE